MREWFVDYMSHDAPMQRFGPAHQWALGLTFLLAVGLPLWAMRLSTNGQRRLLMALGLITAGGYWGWLVCHVAAGTFDARHHLPAHLCFLTAILMPVLCHFQHARLFQVLYYWTFSGVIQAAITPAEIGAAPHLDFFRFWMMHSGSIICIVLLIVVFDHRPSWKGVGWAFVAALCFWPA